MLCANRLPTSNLEYNSCQQFIEVIQVRNNKMEGIMNRLKNMPKWNLVLVPALILGYIVFDEIVLTRDDSTTLSWAAPTGNENNNSLTDLAGYNIYCWAGPDQYTNTIHIDDPATTSYAIEGFAPGTYHCAISTINADGKESVLSNVVAKSVP